MSNLDDVADADIYFRQCLETVNDAVVPAIGAATEEELSTLGAYLVDAMDALGHLIFLRRAC